MRRTIAVLALIVLVASVACSAAQRRDECTVARAGDGALDTLVSWVVGAVLNGTTASAELTRAIDAIEAAIHGAVPVACPAPQPASMRLRAAIASHPAPRP